jgi:hypothetical protein
VQVALGVLEVLVQVGLAVGELVALVVLVGERRACDRGDQADGQHRGQQRDASTERAVGGRAARRRATVARGAIGGQAACTTEGEESSHR